MIKLDPAFHNTGIKIWRHMTRSAESTKAFLDISEEIGLCLTVVGDPEIHGKKTPFVNKLNANADIIFG